MFSCRDKLSVEGAEVEAMAKRKIFEELMEGVAAMKSQRQGKIKLRTYLPLNLRLPS